MGTFARVPHTSTGVATLRADDHLSEQMVPVILLQPPQRQSPVDLEFDVALPRPLPFAIPAELDIPDRPMPVPESAPSSEPARIPTPAKLPEVRKTEIHSSVRQAKPEVELPRALLIEMRTETVARVPREMIAEGSGSTAPRAVLHAPEVEAFAAASAGHEPRIAQVQKRGRVQPLRIAPARPEAPPVVHEVAVRTPEPTAFEFQAPAEEAVRQGHLESPSVHVPLPKPDAAGSTTPKAKAAATAASTAFPPAWSMATPASVA